MTAGMVILYGGLSVFGWMRTWYGYPRGNWSIKECFGGDCKEIVPAFAWTSSNELLFLSSYPWRTIHGVVSTQSCECAFSYTHYA